MGSPSLVLDGYQGFFPGINRPGHEAYHSSPTVAEVKKSVTIPTLLCVSIACTSTNSALFEGGGEGCVCVWLDESLNRFVFLNITALRSMALYVYHELCASFTLILREENRTASCCLCAC